MSKLLELIDKERLPKHVAIIMDGNGRWAKKHGKPRVFGHKNGVKSVRATSEIAAEMGIDYLTLYAFSTENWKRPILEVNALMSLLVDTIGKETRTMMDNNIKLNAIGDISKLPKRSQAKLEEAIKTTSGNEKMLLTLALSYSSKWEITEAVKKIARKVQSGEISIDQITEDLIDQHLETAGIPDPELIIRTSGEKRISNYLLWQIAYSEFYFTDKFWPEFNKDEFCKAIIEYQSRERRFGKISEQLKV
jgi:undecaprenyl diphosphate synthase